MALKLLCEVLCCVYICVCMCVSCVSDVLLTAVHLIAVQSTYICVHVYACVCVCVRVCVCVWGVCGAQVESVHQSWENPTIVQLIIVSHSIYDHYTCAQF